MRIAIHAPAARMGGARSHLVGLVPELAAIAPEDAVLLLAQPDLLDQLPPLPATWELRAERAQDRGLAQRLYWEQRVLPRIAGRWQADVILSFGSFVPLRSPCPTVAEAGNALFFTPQFWLSVREQPVRAQASEIARFLLLEASLRSAARVLVPTRSMRQDVVSRLPEIGQRVDVALWGVAPQFHQTRWQPAGRSGRTILGVSKHGINKEFDVLVQALADLTQTLPDVRLLLTGTPEESQWSRETARLVHRLELDQAVEWLGDVPNSQMPAVVAAADVLVFPTWCESFGLPLAEALAMGAPAIAADIPACREVGADAARYYRPGDASSLREQLHALLTEPETVASLSERASERGAVFQWRTNAIEVRRCLERAIASGPRR